MDLGFQTYRATIHILRSQQSYFTEYKDMLQHQDWDTVEIIAEKYVRASRINEKSDVYSYKIFHLLALTLYIF